MVWKLIVDLMGIHIGFGHIRPMEGSIGIFILFFWRFYRFLTTRSLCSLTCPESVQLSTKLFFIVVCKCLLFADPWSVDSCIPLWKYRYSGQWIPTSLSFKNRTDSVVRGSLRPSKKSDTAVRRSLDSLKIQTVLAVRRLKHLSFKNRTDSWIPASPLKIWTHSAVRRSLHPPLKFQTDLAVRGFHHLPTIEPIRLSMDPLSKFGPIRLSEDPRMPF